MGFAVFVHRADSIYDDRPDQQYQFPKQYLSRARAAEGDWIVYYEPTKVRATRGYFAIARVEAIVKDSSAPGMYLALMEPGSYLPFSLEVPFILAGGRPAESGLLNDADRLSGRAQAAVRTLSPEDFNTIVALGLSDNEAILPRLTDIPSNEELLQIDDFGQMPFEIERPRSSFVVSRPVRDRVFRTVILRAYDEKCAVTGFNFINGGGRAEVAAAHIKPVEAGGPDLVQNGVALSGTVHWMFDRGLISFSDDLNILVSRQVNDREGVESLINATGRLIGPRNSQLRPHPTFLSWHRENCFKT